MAHTHPESSLDRHYIDVEAIYGAFDSYNIAIAIYGKDGYLIDLNESACSLYGIYNKEKFIAARTNFSNNLHYKISFDPHAFSSKEILTRIMYDRDLDTTTCPDFFSGKGQFLLSLRIRPIYDNEGNLLYFLSISRDLSSMKRDKSRLARLADMRSFMMGAEGISTWMFDINTGRRILDAGAHLFPSMEYMKDFLKNVNVEDACLLQQIIRSIQIGNKMEGKAIIRIIDPSRSTEYLVLEVFCTPSIEDGIITGIYFLTKDITDKEEFKHKLKIKETMLSQSARKMAATNTLLYTIIDRMPCLFFAKDVSDSYRYVLANELFSKRMGRPISSIIGHTDFELIHDLALAEQYRFNDIKAGLQGTLSTREEYPIEGVRRVFNTEKYYIVTPEQRKLIIGISQDITDIDDSLTSMKSAKESAERSEKMKSSFLANVSHEIRTPLNAIMGFSHLLMEADTIEERKEYEDIISSSCNSLTEIVNEILELSKIEAGYTNLDVETFDLTAFIHQFSEEYCPKMKKGVSFITEAPYQSCMITTDRTNLNRIIDKILSTAIDYTESGTITLGFDYFQEGVATIYSKNVGKVFSLDEIEAAYERFEKIDYNNKGIGLTIPISRILAKILGGTLDITQESGRGFTIKVTIPATLNITSIK